MSGFLEQQRQEIIDNRNTAQAEMLTKIRHQLSSSTKALTELRFPVPLSGDIDFSRLPIDIKASLRNVQAIYFSQGELTSVDGWKVLPLLKTLEIPRNYLTKLIHEPKTGNLAWTTLDVEGNGLETIEWSKFPQLKHVNVSRNQLKKIDRLPDGLETLHAENNQIEFLNLSNCRKLTYANVSDNSPLLVLVPPPPETEAEIINDQKVSIPLPVEVSSTSSNPQEEKNNEEASRNIEYREALQAYFELKKRYEETNQEIRRKTWNKNLPQIGKKATQALIRSLVPKCLNCQQAGGIIFAFRDQKYIAHCGAANPCHLDIQLFRAGNYVSLFDFWKESVEILEQDKQAHIAIQHDIEYGYLDEWTGLKREKRIRQEYEDSQQIVDNFKLEYEKLYSEERKEDIRNKQRQIYEWIAQNEALLLDPSPNEKPNENQEEEEAHEQEGRIERVVETEIQELFPAVKQLRRLLFDNVQVVKEYREEYLKPISEKETRQRLFQETIALGKFDYSASAEPPAVVKFVGL